MKFKKFYTLILRYVLNIICSYHNHNPIKLTVVTLLAYYCGVYERGKIPNGALTVNILRFLAQLEQL